MTENWKIETSDEAFEQDVDQASHDQLVIVDFWATWCQPCRMLEPILDEVVGSHQGRVRLVKAETDHNPIAAGKYGVQGIPAVYAVAHGKIVDGFSGVMPQSAIEEWVKQHLLAFEIESVNQLDEDRSEEAIARLREIHTEHPKEYRAVIGLIERLIQVGEVEESQSLLELLEQRGFLEPEAESLKAQLELARHGDVDIDEVTSRWEADPENFDFGIEYAQALAVHSRHQEALDVLLDLVNKNAGEQKDKAREQMVDLFRVIKDEELVREYRKKLSLALY